MFILGSSSPRRQELLKKLVKEFIIIKPTFDESKIKESSLMALHEAEGKMNSLKNKINNDDCLLCCDTIVCYRNKVFGKPKNEEDAFNTLKFLSNKTHKVISGYVVFYKNNIIKKQVITKVRFNKLNDELIKKYIKETNPFDKAGSYAIQDDEKFHLIKFIKGSFDNVMGFPSESISKTLKKLKIII